MKLSFIVFGVYEYTGSANPNALNGIGFPGHMPGDLNTILSGLLTPVESAGYSLKGNWKNTPQTRINRNDEVQYG